MWFTHNRKTCSESESERYIIMVLLFLKNHVRKKKEWKNYSVTLHWSGCLVHNPCQKLQ